MEVVFGMIYLNVILGYKLYFLEFKYDFKGMILRFIFFDLILRERFYCFFFEILFDSFDDLGFD